MPSLFCVDILIVVLGYLRQSASRLIRARKEENTIEKELELLEAKRALDDRRQDFLRGIVG
jgi:hypothetical protein